MQENEITSLVINAAIQVHKELGLGLLESAYKSCLDYELRGRGIFIEKEKPMPLVYKDIHLDCGYRLDFLVENKIVVEIKSVETLTDVHIAQTLTYMKLGGFKIGLLINFNVVLLKHGIKRLINGYL